MKDEYDFSNATRGAVVDSTGKTCITIFLDDDILATFREQAAQSGKGYQTLINEALRAGLSPESAPLTVEMLRKVLHEELHVA
ncbi:MAG: CopG family transcriptional regulator [Methylobacter sp.]|nr:MAG: CopG family transcriptional regulator [Methylobacter sp.]